MKVHINRDSNIDIILCSAEHRPTLSGLLVIGGAVAFIVKQSCEPLNKMKSSL